MKFSFAPINGNGKTTSQRNAVIFWLLCLIICYQAGYQVFVSFVLWEDHTALDPWCNGAQNSAQQCVEAQLFRGWQQDELNPLESESREELGHLLHQKVKQAVSTTVEASAAPREETNASSIQEPASPTVLEAGASNASSAEQQGSAETPWAKNLIAVQQKFEERMRSRQAARAAHRNQLAHSTIKEWHNMSTLSKDLQALHDRFGARLQDQKHRDDSGAASEEFANLSTWAKDVAALQDHYGSQYSEQGQPADNMTAWSRDLKALQHRLEVRMEAHNKAHEALASLDARIEAHKSHPAGEGHVLLDEIAALGKELCAGPRHQHDPKCKQFMTSDATPITTTARMGHLRGRKWKTVDEAESQLNGELHELAEKQHAWERSFVAKVSDTMAEFCHDAIHKDQPTCIQFLHDHPDRTEVDDAASKRRAWHQKFASKIANVGHELCSNPMRRDYRICKQILGEEHSTGNKRDAGHASSSNVLDDAEDGPDYKSEQDVVEDRHQRLDLHWSAVTDRHGESSKGLRHPKSTEAESGAVSIRGGDITRLRTASHWSGRIPSVACITLVPTGTAAKAWMQYFIDNFRLQRYEGALQLVLVYHHTDHQAAEIVHKHADGSFIHAAVARGEDYPSAAAFRFGAWIARDVDVIARWDFSAWHHPHRLSMQVRSLAFSERPAGLLERWTVVDQEGANSTARDGEYWDSTLVGEAAWMRKNWYPYMVEEHGVFDAHAASDLVKLDEPELEVFDEACRS